MNSRHILIRAAFCLCGLVFADQDTTAEVAPGVRPWTSSLPVGAQIVRLPIGHWDDSDVLCTQDATYECDVDGDGESEILVFFARPHLEPTREMHLGILDLDKMDGKPTWRLVAECGVDGSYFWSRNLVLAVRGQKEHGTIRYCATAFGASLRANIVEVSICQEGKTITCSHTILKHHVEQVSATPDAIEYTVAGQKDSQRLLMKPHATLP